MFAEAVVSRLQAHVSTVLNRLQTIEDFDKDVDYSAADSVHDEKYSFKMVNDHPVLQSMLSSKKETFLTVYANKKQHQSAACDANVETMSLAEAELQSKLPSLADELGLDVVEGRPLECPFRADDPGYECSIVEDKSATPSVAENPYPPMTVTEANMMIGIFRDVMKLKAKKGPEFVFPPFAILCDGKDAQGTLAIGMHQMPKRLKRFRIYCKDILYSAKEVPSFKSLQNRHLMGRPNNFLHTEAKAKYVITESTDGACLDSSTETYVSLQCEWRNVRQVLETPSRDAQCTVHFRIFLGDSQASQAILKSKWEELMIVERLVQALASNDSSWPSSSSDVSVLDKLAKLLDDMKTVEIRKNATTARTLVDYGEPDAVLINKSLSLTRQNLDFTEKLWAVLKDCSSQDELRACLNIVLLAVQSEEFKQIKFGPPTKLGKIVKDVYRQNAQIPDLHAMNPLSLLLEIGIEKLRQDYIFMFIISGLATKDILSPFMKNDSSNFNESFSCLKKLHCVTELIVLCCATISDGYSLVSTYARMALNQVSTGPFDCRSHCFSFQIDRQYVLSGYKASLSPTEWQICFKSKEDEYITHSTHRLTTVHPLDTFDKASLALPSGVRDGRKYYMCNSSIVEDVF